MTRKIENDVFYIHLDSSKDDEGIFPDNNLGDFTVLLQDCIDLRCDDPNEHWEVALEEIKLPNCLMNVLEGHNKVEYSVILDNYHFDDTSKVQRDLKYGYITDVDKKKGTLTIHCPFYLPTGYMDVMSVVHSINNHLMVIQQAIRNQFDHHAHEKDMQMRVMYYAPKKKLVFYHSSTKHEKLTIPSEKLRILMGLTHPIVPHYEPLEIKLDKKHTIKLTNYLAFNRTEAPHTCNFNRHFQNIFVHCDIVEESIINDKYATILRILDISSLMARASPQYPSTNINVTKVVGLNNKEIENIKDNDELVYKYLKGERKVDEISHHAFPVLPSLGPTFQRLHFIPVNTHTLQKISFKLANEFGEDVKFVETSDVTTLVLCFRKVRYL